MFFVVPALFGALSTVATTAIVAAAGAKTAMVAGTAVGTAVALSRVADSRKAKERSNREASARLWRRLMRRDALMASVRLRKNSATWLFRKVATMLCRTKAWGMDRRA